MVNPCFRESGIFGVGLEAFAVPFTMIKKQLNVVIIYLADPDRKAENPLP